MSRFDPSPGARSRFSCQSLGKTPDSNCVTQVYEDGGGRLWAGTANGVFVADVAQHTTSSRSVVLSSEQLHLLLITQDGTGAVWFATNGHGLFQMRTRGSIHHYGGSREIQFVRTLFTDRSGRVVWN